MNLNYTSLEKLHIYGSWLKRILPSRQAPQGEDVTDDMLDMAAYRLQKDGDPQNASLGKDDTAPVSSIREATFALPCARSKIIKSPSHSPNVSRVLT